MKYVVAMICLACAIFARAEEKLLYWQIDLETENPYGVPDFSYATVTDNRTGSRLSFYDTSGDTGITEMGVDNWNDWGDSGKKAGPGYTGINTADSPGSFLFELWLEDTSSASSSLVGWATYDYDALSKFLYNPSSTDGSYGYMPLTVVAIPEPSSALLLLLGLAGLAIKRRKA